MPSRSSRSRSLFSLLWRSANHDDIQTLIRRLIRLTRKAFSSQAIVQELTYSDAIAYLVDHKPNDPRFAKGAILLQPQKQGILTFFLFLAADNTPLSDSDGKFYGKKILGRKLDEELLEAFDGTELLLLE